MGTYRIDRAFEKVFDAIVNCDALDSVAKEHLFAVLDQAHPVPIEVEHLYASSTENARG